jgi:hypothetical protein
MNVTFDGGASTKGGTVNAKFTFDAQDKEYTFEGNGLMDADNNLYLRVKSIDALVSNYRSSVPAEALPLFDQIIGKINNKWVKVGADDVRDYSPELATTQKCTADVLKKIQGDKAVKAELATVYKNHPFIKVEKTLGVKDGSLGYTLSSDLEVSKAFIKEYKNTSFYKSLLKCDDSLAIDENEVTKSDDNTQVDVWIDRWSHQITNVTMKSDEDGTTTNLSIQPKFNQPVTINAPKDATTIKQLQEDIMTLLQSASADSTMTPAVPSSEM